MTIQENISLKKFHTFGIEVSAKYYAEIHTLADLTELISTPLFKENNYLVLGGGSNVLFTENYNGLVIRNCLTGKKVIEETDQHILVEVMGGEIWHDFVLESLENHWYGIENLSLIPGTVGASPIQNIGAYGVELKEVFHSLKAIEWSTGKEYLFDKETCRFGYRDSIFKNEAKGKYFITSVTFLLSKMPTIKVDYGDIKNTLSEMGILNPSPKDVSNAVVAIRTKKLPNPAEIGNAGSFFKNPEVPKSLYDNLKKEFEDIPGYIINDSTIKIPAGWLIEKAGWKGKSFGDYGVHKNQALVLVNYGNAKGEEVYSLALQIKDDVYSKFGVEINPEVNLIKNGK